MSFGNPIVAGDELVRNRIRSPNYKKGIAGWAINADGSSEFNNDIYTPSSFNSLSVSESLKYKGTELQALLDALPKGVIAVGGGSGSLTLGTGEHLFALGSFTAHPGRRYRVHASPVELDPQTTGRTAYGYWRYRTDGVTPTPSDPPLYGGYSPASYGKTAWGQSIEVEGWITNTGASPVTYTLGLFYGVGEGDTTTSLNLYFGKAMACTVEDMGQVGQVNGTVHENAFNVVATSNTAPAPPPTQYSFSDLDTATASYTGSGAQSAGSGADLGSYMYFGQDPGYSPNGIWRSYFWTNLADIQAMANYASLTQLDIYVYVDHWYYNSGGTLCIGYTPYNPNGPGAPGTEPGGAVYDLLEVGFSGTGGQWISLLNVPQITNAIKNGTFGGIVLNPNKNGYNYYGYAEAHDSTFGRPTLRATYTK